MTWRCIFNSSRSMKQQNTLFWLTQTLQTMNLNETPSQQTKPCDTGAALHCKYTIFISFLLTHTTSLVFSVAENAIKFLVCMKHNEHCINSNVLIKASLHYSRIQWKQHNGPNVNLTKLMSRSYFIPKAKGKNKNKGINYILQKKIKAIFRMIQFLDYFYDI